MALIKPDTLIFFSLQWNPNSWSKLYATLLSQQLGIQYFLDGGRARICQSFAMNPFNIHISFIIFARPTSSRDIQVSHAQYMSRSFGLTLACQDPFLVSHNTCYFWKRISHFCSVILASLSQLTAQSTSPTPPHPFRVVGNYDKALLREKQSDFYMM